MFQTNLQQPMTLEEFALKRRLELAPLSELADFLRVSRPSLYEIAKYLVEKTLVQFGVEYFTFSAVRENGAVIYPTGFGYDPNNFFNDPERHVSTDTPANEMLRTGKIIKCGSFDEYLFSMPQNADLLFPHGFQDSFAFPISGFGGAICYCKIRIDIDGFPTFFLTQLGAILGLYLSLYEKAKPRADAPSKQPEQFLTFTKRQWVIYDAMKKGLTNLAIAHRLGVSESTVRHETMRIYQKLNVRGRVDLLEDKATAFGDR